MPVKASRIFIDRAVPVPADIIQNGPYGRFNLWTDTCGPPSKNVQKRPQFPLCVDNSHPVIITQPLYRRPFIDHFINSGSLLRRGPKSGIHVLRPGQNIKPLTKSRLWKKGRFRHPRKKNWYISYFKLYINKSSKSKQMALSISGKTNPKKKAGITFANKSPWGLPGL